MIEYEILHKALKLLEEQNLRYKNNIKKNEYIILL